MSTVNLNVIRKIDSAQITSARKARMKFYEILYLGTQRSVRCPY